MKEKKMLNKSLPISEYQKRFFLEWVLAPSDTAYNTSLVNKIAGNLDENIFRQACEVFIKQNEVMHARYSDDGLTCFYQNYEIDDFYRESTLDLNYSVESQLRTVLNTPFDLTKDALLRLHLIKNSKPTTPEYYFIISAHHIIGDAISALQATKQIQSAYNSIINGSAVSLECDNSFSHAVELEQQTLDEEYKSKAQNFWLNFIDSSLPQPNLPYRSSIDYINLDDRQSDKSGEFVYFDLNPDQTAQLKAYAKQNKTTVFITLSTIYGLVLSKYCNQEKIVLSYPINMRPKGFSEVTGCFVNNLPLEINFSSAITIKDVLESLGKQRKDVKPYQGYSLIDIIQDQRKYKNSDFSKILKIGFVQANLNTTILDLDGVEVSSVDISASENVDFEVALLYDEYSSNLIKFKFEYRKALLDRELMDRFISSFRSTILRILNGEEISLKTFSALTPEEYQQIVYQWNATNKEYPKDKTIHQLFQEQAARTPDSIAIVYEGQTLTYQQLNELSNQLAWHIRKQYKARTNQKFRSDTLIALYMDRGTEMIVSILAVFKAGGAYVPIDTTYPQERLDYILKDTGVELILSLQHLFDAGRVILPAGKTIYVDLSCNIYITGDTTNLPNYGQPKNLAYIIYTSGTTGKPKGVMVEHVGMLNHILSKIDMLNVDEDSRIVQNASQCFDISVWQFLTALISGGTTYIYSNNLVLNPSKMIKQLIYDRITILEVVPTFLNLLLENIQTVQKLVDLKFCLVTGEEVKKKTVKKWFEQFPGKKLVNAYGPTEASDDITHYVMDSVPSNSSIPIGRPIQNMNIYIIDKYLQPCPVGINGELVVSGVGVGRGYLNNALRTKQSFLFDPFLGKDNVRLYRTGDLARYLSDGNIEFLGRNDDQVKIHGFRIELGEIEQAMLQVSGIKQCCVIARERKAEVGTTKYLIGYYVAEAAVQKLNQPDIMKKLARVLPEYMVPTSLIEMESFPLTPNGKLDRLALPDPDFNSFSEDYTAPNTDTEIQISRIWAEILGLEKVGTTDDFFKIGGDSILSIQASSRIRQLGFGCQVKDIFEYRTISKIAEHLIRNDSLAVTQTEQEVLVGAFDLLPVQQWFFDRVDEGELPKAHHWNQSFLVRTPELSIDRLEIALEKLMDYHDMLRVRFVKENGNKGWQQVYQERADKPTIKTLDVRQYEPIQLQEQLTSWQSGFDLKQGPLLQIGYLYGYENNSARIYFALHHTIVDAVSWRILVQDIKTLYEEKSLPLKGSSYRQWVNGVKQYTSTHPQEASYWRKYLKVLPSQSGFIQVNPTIVAAKIELETDLSGLLLHHVSDAYHTQINDLLLTALAYSLKAISQSNVQGITIEGHGREDIDHALDTSRTVGWFTTMYPIKLELQESLGESIKQIKEEIRSLPNKGIGFGAFAAEAESGFTLRDLPPISFNYLGQFDSPEEVWQITSEESGCSMHAANADHNLIDINGGVSNGKLMFSIASRLDQAINHDLAAHFKVALVDVIEHCKDKLESTGCSYTPSDFSYAKLSQQLIDRLELEARKHQRQIRHIYPASSLQQGFIYHALSQSDDDAYRIQLLYDYHQKLDVGKYLEAWRMCIRQYPILRTAFNWEEGVIQVIYDEGQLRYQLHDLSNMDSQQQRDEAICNIQTQDRMQSFDLSQPTLIRLHIIKQREDYYTILKSNHHSISDGWSLPVLITTLHGYYEELIRNREIIIKEDLAYLKTQEFIAKEKERVQSYWDNSLSNIDEANDISPLLSQPINLSNYHQVQIPATSTLEVHGATYNELKNFCSSEGITVNVVLQFVWHKLLQVYSHSSRSIVGTTVSGRGLPVEGINSSVGLYINTLPLIVDWDNDNSTREQLQHLQKSLAELNTHSFADLARMQRQSHHLFYSLFVFENYPVPKGNKHLSNISIRQTIEKVEYPITVLIYEQEDGLTISLKYDQLYLKEEQAGKHVSIMEHILKQIISKPQRPHKEICLLPNKEYEQIIYQWNKTDKDYPKDKTIHALFQEQAECTPENIAVVYEDQTLTYKELNERSNQLARHIRTQYKAKTTQEFKADTLIAIYLDKSLEMVVGILAVLKAGGAYVPIDTSYPQERLDYILEDTGAEVILSQKHLSETRRTTLPSHKVLHIDLSNEIYTTEIILNLPQHSMPTNLAYAIYTSGTTGNPKGTLLTHLNLCNLAYCQKDILRVDPSTKMLQYASLVFDASVWEIFCSLPFGAMLFIVSDHNRLDTNLLCEYLLTNKINIALLPPALLSAMPYKELIELTVLVVGGEACPIEIMERWSQGRTLINAYGPTEGTVISNMHVFAQGDSNTNIGKPLDNTRVYILDTQNIPVPVGLIGELYIGGAGISRGYLKHPELTAERFTPNPFATKMDRANGYDRLYKTGDLARWLPDGSIEFIGRNDDQVKIRGFRIELGEIEQAMLQINGIKQSHVIPRERKTDASITKYLVGYYILEAGFEISQTDILEKLAQVLPDYMIPTSLIEMETFPLTINGKIDKGSLPEPNFAILIEGYTTPNNNTEVQICNIWKETLGLENVGTTDDFFRIGGNSILAIQVSHQMSKHLECEVKVADIFKYKTILEILAHNPWQEQIIIPKTTSQESPLSFAQERLWFIEQYEQGSNAYHIPVVLELMPHTDINGIKYALQQVVMRHEVLRSTIVQDENQEHGLQVAHTDAIEIEDITINTGEDYLRLIQLEVNRPFDLSKEYPIRVKFYNIVPIEKEGAIIRRLLLIDTHHIACDGWSVGILQRELLTYYDAYKRNDLAFKLPELDIQYKDFAVWQREYVKGNVLDRQITYWRDKLSGFQTLKMPTDFVRPAKIDHRGAYEAFTIERGLSDRLRALSRANGTSIHGLMLSSIAILLHKYSGQEDIVVGSPTANRHHRQTQDIIGFFVNTQVNRIQLDSTQNFQELILQVQKDQVAAQEHQDLPFERLMEELEIPRDTSRHPIFQVMFGVQSFGSSGREMDQLEGYFKPLKLSDIYGIEKFDLSIFVDASQDELQGQISYATSLFSAATMRRLICHYQHLLTQLCRTPEKPYSQLPLLSAEDYSQIVYQWNKTDKSFTKDKTIHQMFQEQAKKLPNSIAIVYKEEVLTYQLLNEKSNQLARRIRHQYRTKTGQELKPDTLIALYLDRSLEMIVGILAVLKAGAAYVPIATSYPQERVNFILEDTGVELILSQKNVSYSKEAILPAHKTLHIDLSDEIYSSEDVSNLPQHSKTTDLAYVIYTSGTTGKPKGAMLNHIGIVNRLEWMQAAYPLSSEDVVLQKTPYVFDVSVWELLWANWYGAKIVLAKPEGHKDSEYLHQLIKKEKVTTLHFVPSMLGAYNQYLIEHQLKLSAGVKQIFCSGEALSKNVVEQTYLNSVSEKFRLHNLYGPTEASVDVTYFETSPNSDVYIGRPIYNTQVYVLDSNNIPVPIGVIGELYLGGIGLSRGYLKRPELTAERFVNNPFATETDKANGYDRLYRTGDLVRWMPDGNIEYHGRNDDQVKIRGFRIELGEIEQALSQVQGIRQCCVLVKERKTNSITTKYIVGYYALEVGFNASQPDILEKLTQVLPEYMIPSSLVEMNSFPLSTNGKLDKQALPEPDFTSSEEYTAPLTDREAQACSIWEKVLGQTQIGITDDFFRIGGNSILALQVSHQMSKTLGYEVKVADIFKYRTIVQLLTHSEKETQIVIPISAFQESQLSFAQERLWFIEQYEQGSNAYHIPVVLELSLNTDSQGVKYALQQIVSRHEVLRSTIVQKENQKHGIQLVHKDTLEIEDVIIGSDEGYISLLQSEINRPFCLSKEYPIRVKLYHIKSAENPNTFSRRLLLVNTHHIASDGWSIGVIKKELVAYYQAYIKGDRAFSLPPLEIQYKDFAVWQRDYVTGQVLEKQIAYWKNKLSGFQMLEMPTDFTRPPQVDYRGASEGFLVSRELSDRISGLCHEYGVTLHNFMLASVSILLSKYTGQEDIVTGSPIANRHHQQTQGLIGFFVNTQVNRIQLDSAQSFQELILQVQKAQMAAQNHQDLPFERLVEELEVPRDISRHPIFQVMFGVQNFGSADEDTSSLSEYFKVQELAEAYKVEKFDLSIFIDDSHQELQGQISYATSLFSNATVQRLIDHYLHLLSQLCETPEQPYNQLSLLSTEEHNQIIYHWNQTEKEYPKDKTIHGLFQEQVKRTPNDIAIIFDGQSLTYLQLNERSNQLARYIRKQFKMRTGRELKPDTLIALYLNRGLEMIVGILAVLKAGGAYVPMDTSYPQERIDYMLYDTETELILSQQCTNLETEISLPTNKVLHIDLSYELYTLEDKSNLPWHSKSHDLAYIIYTSGTTGKPKGVMIEHCSVINYVYNTGILLSDTVNVDFSTNIAFDLTITTTICPLLIGKKVFIYSGELVDNNKYTQHLVSNKIDFIKNTPSLLANLSLNYFGDYKIKQAFVGGEKLESHQLHHLSKYIDNPIDEYGPTETTVGAIFVNKRNTNQHYGIGKPYYNYKVYILDRQNTPVPIGVIGELYIGGAGVARGYLKQPELTAERFVPNPFATDLDKTNGYNRLYKTGDLVRWLSDGNIEFIGRNDSQVKIRGFRIELGEIEQTMLKVSGINQSCVLVKERKTSENINKYLVGYYVLTPGYKIDQHSITEKLTQMLPEYMVPTLLIELESFPLTTNGKLDKLALPNPNFRSSSKDYTAPLTDPEIQISQIWGEILGLEKVGITDDFFRIGGNSILAIQVSHRMSKLLGCEVKVVDIFKYKTISEILTHNQWQTQIVIPRTTSLESPLSFAQERLWFIEQYEQGSNAYHIPVVMELEPLTDVQGIKYALQQIVMRHEVLRSTITQNEKQKHGVQIAHNDALIIEDITLGANDDYISLLQSEVNRPFDLSREYPIRVILYHIKSAENPSTISKRLLLINIHHIASDGWSIGILQKELLAYYEAYIKGEKTFSLPPLDIQYKDFAIWQRNYVTGQVLEKQIAYWKNKLSGFQTLEMPIDCTRPSRVDYSGSSEVFTIESLLSNKLRALSQANGVSMHNLMLSSIAILLSKYSGQEDIVMGSPIANRHYSQTQDLIGFFINTQVNRIQLNRIQNFQELILQVQQDQMAAQGHQDLPFERLVEELEITRDTSRHPIFQVMFGVQSFGNSHKERNQLEEYFKPIESSRVYTVEKFDLSIFIDDGQDELQGQIGYATSLFENQTIKRLICHYQQLLLQLCSAPEQPYNQLSLLSEKEYEQIVYQWNKTDTDYPRDKTIHRLFEEQVERTPDSVAIAFEGQTLSYRQLNQRSNQLARHIRHKYKVKTGQELKPDTPIALFLDRGLEMIIGSLAILKAGCAYVPMDTSYPQERVDYILEDTEVALIMSQKHLNQKGNIVLPIDKIINIDLSSKIYTNNQKTNLRSPSQSTNLAYIIYTSGSTGKPKGVEVCHSNLSNLCMNIINSFHITRNTISSQLISITFDAAVSEIYPTLISGGVLQIIPESIKHGDLISYLKEAEISHLSIPADLLASLEHVEFNHLKSIHVGGGICSINKLNTWSKGRLLINAYGPTECTVCVTMHPYVSGDTNTNIGKPLANTNAYILDSNHAPVPIGIAGELYIGGASLARGYLKRPELTAERFIPNPFATKTDRANGYDRLYKTGDLARWLPDGSIEFIGRNDDQVKIRGFRIELGEVEQAMLQISGIKQCCVLPKERKTEAGSTKYLVGYYTPDAGYVVNQPDVLKKLTQVLPEYMIPASLVEIESFPLTINGKLDKRALPDAEFTPQAEHYVAPCTEVEIQLCSIWQEVLGIEHVGVTDDFFRIGGDSILSIQVSGRIRQLGLNCQTKDIFEHKTITRLIEYLIKKSSISYIQNEQGILTGAFGLLPIQQWFFDRINKGELPQAYHWNQSFLVRIPELSLSKLETALEKLMDYHDVLRVGFIKENGDRNWQQVYQESVAKPIIKTLDVSHCDQLKLHEQLTSWQSTFDLEHGPLFQMGYIYGYNDDSARLYFALHHTIVDAVSWRILAEDIKALYEGKTLPQKGSSYRQWVQGVKQYASKHPQEEAFWEKQIKQLPRWSKPIQVKATTTIEFVEIEANSTDLLLHHISDAYHTQINDLLLTALAYSLKAINGSNVQGITLEGHGREGIDETLDISHTVGWFTIMFPIRLELQETMGESIKFIKENLRSIPKKGIGYGAFAFETESKFTFGDLPPISFNYLGQFDSSGEAWQITSEGSGSNIHDANTDHNLISIIGGVTSGKLTFSVTSCLGQATTHDLAVQFKTAIVSIIEHCKNMLETYGSSHTPSDFAYVSLNQRLIDYLEQNAREHHRKIQHIYSATSLQQGFIYHALSQDEDDAYRVQLLYDYNQQLDLDKYLEAWRLCIRQYPILRTAFNWENGVVQIIYDEGMLNYQLHDISHISSQTERDAAIDTIQAQDRKQPFDLAQPTLMRLHIIKQGENCYTILKSEHHSISDGWSGPILLTNLHRYYEALVERQEVNIKEEQAYLQTQEYTFKQKESLQAHWQKILATVDGVNDINPLLSHPINSGNYRLVEEPQKSTIKIKKEVYKSLKNFCSHEGITVNVMVQFAWHKLLQVYSSSCQSIVGTTVSGRDLPIEGVESSVGLYINTLPLIIEWDNEHSVQVQLHQIQQRLTELNSHSFADLARVQQQGQRLFHSLLVFENYPIPKDGKHLSDISIRQSIEKVDYPLSILAYEQEDGLIITLQYDGVYLNKEKADKFTAVLEFILEQAINEPQKFHKELSLLSVEEYEQIVYQWNKTDVEYPRDKTIHGLFQEQVERTPESIAIVYEGQSLTYWQLNQRSNQLARYIRAQYQARTNRELKADTLIALYLERSLEMVIGILAVLKAGGAYVPMDTSYPQERVDYLLEDSGAELILSQRYADQGRGSILPTHKVLNIDLSNDFYSSEGMSNLPSHSAPTDLAYVIYTSGTTGKPKGVMVEHRGINNLVQNQAKGFGVEAGDKAILFASYVFDATISEIFTVFTRGASLHIIPDSTKHDTNLIGDFIQDQGVKIATLPPVLLSSMSPKTLPELKTLVVAGETCPAEVMEVWSEGRRLINAYGPTEGTVCTTMHRYSSGDINTNIGKPLGNIRVYVLDASGSLVPVGVSGELYIGGAGIARGYLKRPELTAERFVPNPFATESDKTKGYNRLYKTGDLVRWLSDGNIEFIGRNDDQVKIRGFRIELGEVEQAMLQINDIKQCCVLAKERKTDYGVSKFLIGYYVCEKKSTGSNGIPIAELRSALSKNLPEHMIPSHFMCLDKLPININGKIDKKALPEPEGNTFSRLAYEAPRNEVEDKLCKIWQDVLGIERVGIHDNFFELGGHSISAMNVVSMIKNRFSIEVPFNLLFRKPQISELSSDIINAELYLGEMLHEDKIYLLNKEGKKAVFAFPPIVGYGIAFKHLSHFVDNFSLYAFDFIEDKNRLSMYVDIILSTQNEDPYILLGYSAGGNLAYEVAVELTARGHQVSDIIMVDALRRYETHNNLDNEYNDQNVTKMMETFMNGYQDYTENPMNLDFIIRRAVQRTKKYAEYMSRMTNDRKIKTNIHLILSEENKDDNRLADWEPITDQTVRKYQGKGLHLEMLSNPEDLMVNAKIIKEIINSQSFKIDKIEYELGKEQN